MRTSRNRTKLAEMVRLITQRGPRIDEISRAIGVHNETARYWYRQLLSKGFVIQASCNYESLGMKRVVALVEVSDSLKTMDDTVFYLLNQFAYVTSYAKTRGDMFYTMAASVPTECVGAWADLMLQLKRMGVLKSIESITLDWVRNVPMRADRFDFDTGRWEFNSKSAKSSPYLDEQVSARQRYDTTDLKIIGQLQVDANMSLAEMCRKVGARNYKTFTWHFREHVFRRGLIKGYRVNWTGVRYNESGRMERRRYSWLDVIADDLSERQRIELATRLNASPFVWMEGSGTRVYYARLAFPIEHATQVVEALRAAVSSVGAGIRWFRLNQSRALYFSLETAGYDERNLRWNLDRKQIVQTLESLQVARVGTDHHRP